jgi:hypothetical protein
MAATALMDGQRAAAAAEASFRVLRPVGPATVALRKPECDPAPDQGRLRKLHILRRHPRAKLVARQMVSPGCPGIIGAIMPPPCRGFARFRYFFSLGASFIGLG